MFEWLCTAACPCEKGTVRGWDVTLEVAELTKLFRLHHSSVVFSFPRLSSGDHPESNLYTYTSLTVYKFNWRFMNWLRTACHAKSVFSSLWCFNKNGVALFTYVSQV